MTSLLNLSSYETLDETKWELKDLGLSLEEIKDMSIGDIESFMNQQRRKSERIEKQRNEQSSTNSRRYGNTY